MLKGRQPVTPGRRRVGLAAPDLAQPAKGAELASDIRNGRSAGTGDLQSGRQSIRQPWVAALLRGDCPHPSQRVLGSLHGH
jgi:hypothetical protein